MPVIATLIAVLIVSLILKVAYSSGYKKGKRYAINKRATNELDFTGVKLKKNDNKNLSTEERPNRES